MGHELRPHRPWAAVAGGVLLVASTLTAAEAPDLIDAVKTGDRNRVETLIAGGADVDARQGDGATALHWAAHRNDLAAADSLIAAGATVNAANALGATPLWLAAMNGSADMVGRLLDANADPNAALKMGETPLMTAARAGSVKTAELLLDRGADPNAAEHERGQTALMWAAAQRHPDVVRLLVDRGADLHARSKVWHQLENTAGNTNPIGNFEMAHGGSTPLLFAARNGDVDTVRVLLDRGADVNDVAAAGTSALVIAAHSAHEALGIYLLEEGADPNASGAGYAALHAAVLRGGTRLVDALLAHGADPNALIEHGTPGRRISADYSLRHQMIGVNAFWLAAQFGELEMLRALAEHGADPLVTPEDGKSALQATVGMPRLYLETRRNRAGIAPPDPVEDERRTLEMARIVVDLGVDVNAADKRGDTAMHDAVRKRFALVVEFLASHGADINATNERDETPLTLAESVLTVPGSAGLRTDRPEIAELLRSLGAND